MRTDKKKYAAYQKMWREKNKEKHALFQKSWYDKNKERCAKNTKAWRARRPGYSSAYIARRIKKDPLFKLIKNIRARNWSLLRAKNFKKEAKFKDYIGCTGSELVRHLESQFRDGMTWNNHGDWHVDHIIPLASAKTAEDVYKLNHYTNLQPLLAAENISKGAKISD